MKLSECKIGKELKTKGGEVVIYKGKVPCSEYHLVEYSDGAHGYRYENGKTFSQNIDSLLDISED